MLLAGMTLALAGGASVASPVTVQIVGGEPATIVRIEAKSTVGELARTVTLANGRTALFELTPGAAWELTASAAGFWASPVDLREHPGKEATISLWPAGVLMAAVRPPAATKAPSGVEIRLTRSERALGPRREPPDVEFSCPVGDISAVMCAVPAGLWDIRVKAPGYVPRYFWGRELRANEKLTLGDIDLKAGSSILGRLTTEDGSADPHSARVTLTPAPQANAGSANIPTQLQRLGVSTVINQFGYFQFDGVAPGSYVILATQMGFEGQAAIELAQQQVLELREPLVMLRPLQIGLAIDPPTDPIGGRWTVVLMGVRNGNLETISEGLAAEDGAWLSQGVTAGQYTVQVRSGTNSLAWKTLEVSRDIHDFEIELQFIVADGKVEIRDEPFAADLWFGGRHGEERVQAQADEDGRFSVVLPHDGQWKVDVKGLKRRVDARGLEVTVKPTRNSRRAEIVISLPSTLIRGFVRDASMRPVEGATVTLVPLDGSGRVNTIITDVLGVFEVEGAPEGTFSIEATAGVKASERKELMVSEDLTPPELELILRDRRQLTGRVTSWSGPVAGAWVLAIPMTAGGGLAAMATPQARTDADGAFRVDLPPDAARLRFVVTMPGYTLAMKTVQLSDGMTSTGIALDQVGGRVELERSQFDAAGLLPIVMIDGQPTDVPLLEMWSRAHANSGSSPQLLVVDAMPPGEYQYCFLKSDEAMLVFAGAAYPSATACNSGSLAANSTLRLSQPRPTH